MIGIVGYVLAYLLAQPGMIFNAYLGFLIDVLNKIDPSKKMNLVYWIGKPLGLCEICFTGQLAFWLYFRHWHNYNFMVHVVYFSLAIFIVHSLTDEQK